VWEWLQRGKSTVPRCTDNSREGVVVEGSCEPVTFEPFEQKLCPLQLLHCYDYQVDRHPRVDDIFTMKRQLEFMNIEQV
jgi:hypothetical protein